MAEACPPVCVPCLKRPGIENEGVLPAVQENNVEYIERADWNHPRHERTLAVPVERLQRETAGVDLAAIGDDLLDAIVEVEVAGKYFVAQFWKSALDTKRDPGPVEQHGRFEAFLYQPRSLKQIKQADRALEGDGVKRYQGFLPA